MPDNQEFVEELRKRFAPEIERLDKMALNLIAVNNIRFIYTQLKTIDVEMTMEFFMEVEALTTALVISYGRLFAKTAGTTKLRRVAVPTDLRSIHDELIEYRNERFAHHGGHETIQTGIELEFDGESITVNPVMQIGFWVGASRAWEPLFVWLSAHMLDVFNAQLAHLSKVSEIDWSMNYGDPPAWVT
ncbi:hypothetical protein [Tropicibacter sp. Alg240-R139]|uniref:hypothetical protein n=1 Tax=Tropicibacter sp. Alg240-R139 TaxID=2305991 RepID=UPI0013E0160F|nr:hypothetical protein [Tropicibacter sp. Alg240-R139]